MQTYLIVYSNDSPNYTREAEANTDGAMNLIGIGRSSVLSPGSRGENKFG